MTGPAMIPVLPAGIPNSVYDDVAEALGDAYYCNRAWSAWSEGAMTKNDFSLAADDDDRVEDIAIAAVLAWEDHLASTGNRPPAIDLEQFRSFIYACGHGSGTFPERRAEADRLLALIDGQAKHATTTPSDRERPTRRRQKAVELLLAQGYHWHDGEWIAPASKRGPDQPDLCDLCCVREEVRSDAEGIPFCQECWDGWQASEQTSKGEGE